MNDLAKKTVAAYDDNRRLSKLNDSLEEQLRKMAARCGVLEAACSALRSEVEAKSAILTRALDRETAKDLALQKIRDNGERRWCCGECRNGYRCECAPRIARAALDGETEDS